MKKTTLIVLLLIVFVLGLSSCSERGVNLSSNEITSDNYWESQAKKIVSKNQKYAKKEQRYALKEKRNNTKVNKLAAKEKKKDKKIAAVQPFRFH